MEAALFNLVIRYKHKFITLLFCNRIAYFFITNNSLFLNLLYRCTTVHRYISRTTKRQYSKILQ